MKLKAQWPTVLIALALLGLFGAFVWTLLPVLLYVPSDKSYASAVLRDVRSLRVDEIEKVVILLNDADVVVRLYPSTDGQDVARLLASVKAIRIADRLARVDISRDRLLIITHDKQRQFGVSGEFDPARAPVISPSMRSDDLSRIVQDIVKRKGKSYARWH